MAIYFVFLMTLIGYIFYSGGEPTATARGLTAGERVADEMAIYHAAARDYCGVNHTLCPQARIAQTKIDLGLPTARKAALGDGRIVSYATTGYIVTYWTQTSTSLNKKAAPYEAINAAMRSRFKQAYRSSIGTYDTATKKFMPMNGGAGVAVPGTVAGTVPDNAPMLVSNF